MTVSTLLQHATLGKSDHSGTSAAAAQYDYIGQIFVDTVNGSDSNNGRSVGAAKRTLAAAKAVFGATVRGEIVIVGGPDGGTNTCFVDTPIVLYDGQTLKSFGHTPAGESGIVVAASDAFVGDAVVMSYTWLTGGTWFSGAVENITVDARNKAPYAIAISQFGEEALLRRVFAKGATDTNIYCAGTHAVAQIEDCSTWWMTGTTTQYGITFGAHPTNGTRAAADGSGGVVRMFGISGDNGPVGSPGTALGHIRISGSHTVLIDGLKSEQWNPVVVIDGSSSARVFLNGDAIKTTPQAGDIVYISGTATPTIFIAALRANQYSNVINDTVQGTTLACPAAGTRVGMVEWSYDAGGVARINNKAGVTIESTTGGVTLGSSTAGVTVGRTGEKVGFFGATPVVRQPATVDPLAALVNTGLMAAAANLIISKIATPRKQWDKVWWELTPRSSTSTGFAGHGSTPGITGTVSHPGVNKLYGYPAQVTSAASTNAQAAITQTTPTLLRGAANDVYAGFFMHARTRYSDASYDNTGATTGSRIWALGGYGSSASTLFQTDRGGTQDLCGFNRENVNGANTDTNWKFVTNDATGPATVADTGIPFTVGHVYDFYIWCPAGSTTIYWQVNDVTAGTTASGGATGTLPRVASGLIPVSGLLSVDATARAMQFLSIYVESAQG